MTTIEQRQSFWDTNVRNWIHHEQFADEKQRLIGFVREGLQTLKPYLPANTLVLNIGSGANNADYFDGIISEKECIALDISRRMLKKNGAKYKVQIDAELPLPVRSNSVDVATSFYLLRYLTWEGQLQLLNELYRILKPGGWMVIVDLPQNNYQYQRSNFYPHKLIAHIRADVFFQLTPVFKDNSSYWIGALYGQKSLPIRNIHTQKVLLWKNDAKDEKEYQYRYEHWTPRDPREGAHGF